MAGSTLQAAAYRLELLALASSSRAASGGRAICWPLLRAFAER